MLVECYHLVWTKFESTKQLHTFFLV